MKLQSRNEVIKIIDTIAENSSINKAKKEFLNNIKEDPCEEYGHTYIHEMLTSGFAKGKRKETIYKILFVISASAFLISLNFPQIPSLISEYLLLTSVIFAAQSR